jgi:pyrroline-5-carboxylate reductase
MFRIIPNTAIEIGSGVTFISSCNASDQDRAMMLEMFSQMGYALEVEEDMMGAGTALASCGIAYAMKYIQASAAGGEALGFSQEQARKIVEYTVKGAAELLLATGTAPQTEIDKVTTPGGMTMKGLAAMEDSGFTHAVSDGLYACLK